VCCLCDVQVETVADTYMVSCGVPVESQFHASELAMMALSLRNSVSMYKVRRPSFEHTLCYKKNVHRFISRITLFSVSYYLHSPSTASGARYMSVY